MSRSTAISRGFRSGRWTRVSVAFSTVALVTALFTVIGSAPASADQIVSQTFTVQCTANLGGPILAETLDVTVNLDVPTSVSPGQIFTVTFPGTSLRLPSLIDGFLISTYTSSEMAIQVHAATLSRAAGNPRTATLVPNPSGPVTTIAENGWLPVPTRFRFGNPGPFVPGTVTSPTMSVLATAPSSGQVTLNAYRLTQTLHFAIGFDVTLTCAIPQTTLATIPVVGTE